MSSALTVDPSISRLVSMAMRALLRVRFLMRVFLRVSVMPSDGLCKLQMTLAVAAVDLLQRREAKTLDAARAPDFDIDKLRAAIAGAKEIH